MYDEQAALSVDIFIHFINEGNLLEITQGVYLDANNTPIRTQNLADSLTNDVLSQVREQHKKVDSYG